MRVEIKNAISGVESMKLHLVFLRNETLSYFIPNKI